MKRAKRISLTGLLAISSWLVSAPLFAQGPQVDGFLKVSEVKVTRTVSEFTYRATLTSSGPALASATVTVTSLSPMTTIVDGTMTFGVVGAGGTVVSGDTFSFRHDRTVPFDWANLQFSVSFTLTAPDGNWEPLGPGPITNGQLEGILDNEVSGAIHAIATHPTDPNVMYAGGINAGVWKTTNATAAKVKWKPLTDHLPSLSIMALELDPTDPTYQTVWAGTGLRSSWSSIGGPVVGLYRTTDGGDTWTIVTGGGTLTGKQISGIAARGNTIVVTVWSASPTNNNSNRGVYRSTNGGATFTLISGGAGTGLPGGQCFYLAADPNNLNRLYVPLTAPTTTGQQGVYRSDDMGATWTKVSNAAMDTQLAPTVTNAKMDVGRHDNPYLAVARSGALSSVFGSTDGGATWSSFGVPTTPEPGNVGVHPGGQASLHMSITVDPEVPTIVYVGGDRQPIFNEFVSSQPNSWPNSIGSTQYCGRLFRGDSALPTATRWAHITHSPTAISPAAGTASNSCPHADSRKMTIDAAGNIIQGDDGGIYKRTLPRSNTGDWFSLNGDIQTTEMHDLAYDSNAKIAFSGDQDTGTPVQIFSGDWPWRTLQSADGGDVAVDDFFIPNTSVRYSSFQTLQGFTRSFWDSANVLLSSSRPPLTPLGGAPTPTGQFTTPFAQNKNQGNRFLIGAGNGVYESLDRGDSISRITTAVANASGATSLAYGAADNPNVIYIGQGNNVLVRTAAPGTAPAVRGALSPASAVRGVAIDPDTATTAFAVNTNAVFRTVNGGTNWTNITGNLQSLSPGTFRSLAYAKSATADAIIVGSANGVYFANAPYTTWQTLGTGLPAVQVYDVDFSAIDDLVVIGTLGRAAWKLRSASAVMSGGL